MAQAVQKAVIYARYSSHSQTEQSIEGQLRICREYAQREGIVIVDEYIDRAVSGTAADSRPSFQKMVRDSVKNQFDFVICYKLDRFARNRYDSATYKAKLKQNGVKVLSATENISDNPESVILEGLLESMAEYYSLELSQKVKRGQRESALKGNFTGGHAPIGYKVENKKLVIDEKTAPFIKSVFEKYAAGISKKELIDELNASGIRNSKGKPLTLSSFQVALKNKKYIGVSTYSGIEYENTCPALISNELFNKVQAMLAANAHAPAKAKAKEKYLLYGKAFCGLCGSNLVGESGKNRHGTIYNYYSCSARKKTKTCNKRTEKKDFLEWYIAEQTIDYVLVPERLHLIAKGVISAYKNEFNDYKILEIEKQISQSKKEAEKLFRLILNTDSDTLIKRYENQISLLDAKAENLDLELSKLKLATSIKYTEKDIILWLKQFTQGDLLDAHFREKIIDTFVNSIYVYDDKIVIYYNVKGSKQVSYIDNCKSLSESENVRINNASPRQIQRNPLF